MPTLTGLEQQLAGMISQQETAGGTAGVGSSLNNPGAIQYAPWESAYGATAASNGFASFPSLKDGMDALTALIDKYVSGGASISSMMQAYAPVSAGNPTTPLRIQALSQATGLNPDAAISSQVTDAGAGANASGSAGAAAPTSTTPAAGSSTAGAVGQGIWNGLAGAFGLQSGSGFDWARIATGIIGVLLLIVGLMQLKQTQVIVQNAMGSGSGGGSAKPTKPVEDYGARVDRLWNESRKKIKPTKTAIKTAAAAAKRAAEDAAIAG